MPLYEIVKADGTREKVGGEMALVDGLLVIYDFGVNTAYAPGTWLEVWRREGVGE